MAVTTAEVGTGVDTRIFDVTATADADTTATIAHGMAAAPEIVILSGLTTGAAGFRLSGWCFAVDATNVTLTKSTAVGSGVAGAQVRCIIKRRTNADR